MEIRSKAGNLFMGQFKHISAETTKVMMAEQDIQLVDIRDEQSYQSGHICGAKHLDNTTLQDFLLEADPDQAVIVCCYHGNSSQSAAAFLNEKGFDEVYSLDGGFEYWRSCFPQDTATTPG
jgi:thiosulfate sulfurtransferase